MAHVRLAAAWLALSLAAGCQAGVLQPLDGRDPATAAPADADPSAAPGAGGEDPAAPLEPFVAVGPETYVPKVKALLTGGVATAAELEQGGTDEGLGQLVDAWMATPAYSDSLLTFFGLALQQSLATAAGIAKQTPASYIIFGDDALMQDIKEVVPRTALQLVRDNQPFNRIATTTTFMVKPSVLLYHALADAYEAPSPAGDWVLYDDPNFLLSLDPQHGATTTADFGNPASPNHHTLLCRPLQQSVSPAACSCNPNDCLLGVPNRPLTFSKNVGYYRPGAIYKLLQGEHVIYLPHVNGNAGCWTPVCENAPIVTGGPDDTWRPVTFRTPDSGQTPNKLWDWDAFKTAEAVTFRIPRVGYFTSLAFLGQWDTNINNQARGTINQTLAVGLGRVFDGNDRTQPTDLRGIDQAHAAPSSPCYGCHLTMDPMREYFRQALTYSYHKQIQADRLAQPGAFAQAGATRAGGDLRELGEMIATSPLFARAWTLKVCAWLNSDSCLESDPEIVRIAAAFAAGNFNFNRLVRDVVTSPLTTYRAATTTAQARGAIASIARRDQLCRALSERLGIADFCLSSLRTPSTAPRRALARLMAGYPADGYARADARLVQVANPSLIARVGLENVCSYAATAVVDGATPIFSSQDPNAAVEQMVGQLLGVTGEQQAPLRGLLQGHYQDALAATKNKTTALQSTFALACSSPYFASVGL